MLCAWDRTQCAAKLSMHVEFPDSTYQSVYLVGTMDSATVSATPTQQQLTDGQTGLPVSTIIIILSTVIPSTLILLMLVCTVVVIILIVRWRIARKQVDIALEHTGKHIKAKFIILW